MRLESSVEFRSKRGNFHKLFHSLRFHVLELLRGLFRLFVAHMHPGRRTHLLDLLGVYVLHHLRHSFLHFRVAHFLLHFLHRIGGRHTIWTHATSLHIRSHGHHRFHRFWRHVLHHFRGLLHHFRRHASRRHLGRKARVCGSRRRRPTRRSLLSDILEGAIYQAFSFFSFVFLERVKFRALNLHHHSGFFHLLLALLQLPSNNLILRR